MSSIPEPSQHRKRTVTADIADRIIRARKNSPDVSIQALSSRFGYSAAVISKVLRGIYPLAQD